jgi:hypothetical protein
MFEPNTTHCTTCLTVNPETDDDGETTCCLDTVCTVDADGRCPRCNPLCGICGFDIVGGYDLDARQRTIHPESRCTDAINKASAAAKKTAKPAVKPQRKLAESAGLVAPVKRASGSHSACEHEATKSARAACRKRNAGK